MILQCSDIPELDRCTRLLGLTSLTFGADTTMSRCIAIHARTGWRFFVKDASGKLRQAELTQEAERLSGLLDNGKFVERAKPEVVMDTILKLQSILTERLAHLEKSIPVLLYDVEEV